MGLVMRYWVCNYHLVWSTKFRQPMITSTMELLIFDIVQQKAHSLKSEILAVNSMPEHIHVIARVNPSVAVSQFVGELKGRTSYEVNQHFNLEEKFVWQASFGGISFGNKDIEIACDYVKRQKEHHSLGTTNRWLENDQLED